MRADVVVNFTSDILISRAKSTMMKLYRQVVQTSENLLGFGKGYSQYYATVDLGKTRVGRTRVLEGNFKDPEWNETFSIFCAHTVSHLVVSIKDAAVVGTAVIGRARIPAIDLLSGTYFSHFQEFLLKITNYCPSLFVSYSFRTYIVHYDYKLCSS